MKRFGFVVAAAMLSPIAGMAQEEATAVDGAMEPVASEPVASETVTSEAEAQPIVAEADEATTDEATTEDAATELLEDGAAETPDEGEVVVEDAVEDGAEAPVATDEPAAEAEAVVETAEPDATTEETETAVDQAVTEEPVTEEAVTEEDVTESGASEETAAEAPVEAPVTEDVAQDPVAEDTPAVVEAAPEPEPVVEEPDPLLLAAEECLAIAGAANAGVPAAAVDAASQKATLAKAAASCTEAATAEVADPQVLFHAAAVAQAKGDAGETFDLLSRAAEAGLGAAETRLGDYFLFGVGPEGQNIDKAVTHYKAAAELGDAAGMTTLALLYQVARGVPRDTARMVELMKSAADQGYHFAQYRLAQTYLKGEGIPGRADATLGIPDLTMAVKYFTAAADAGNLSAALELSTLYADPNSGLPDDAAEQVRLTRMVSKTGHPPAVAMMGVFYETGRGVDYDPKVAAGLYVKAMESGKLAFDDLRRGAPRAWDRDTALAFQQILQDRGLYDGALDAIVGPGTARAARALAGN